MNASIRFMFVMTHISARLSSDRFRPLLALGAWYLALGFILRIMLWWSFARVQQVGAGALAGICLRGVLSDAMQALFLLLPFALCLWLTPDRQRHPAWHRAALIVASYLWMFGLTFVTAIEFYFFQEFDSRFNLVAVDYLLYPTEVVGDIWAEYPVLNVVITIAVITAVTLWLMRAALLRRSAEVTRFPARSLVMAVYVLVLVAIALAPDAVTHPVASNRVAAELAANGPASFFRALRTSEIDYPAYYATRNPADNLRRLTAQLSRGGGKFVALDDGRLDRSFPARSDGLGKLNVVVMPSESFGAEFSKLYGSERDWMPSFDSFAQKSIWFRHTYASGTRTVRGLEAITASFPPIPTTSIVRRPGNDDIATWGKVMRGLGYQTSFLYGGYGYFDNMNAFYAANGFEVRDRTDIPKPVRFGNIWGVSDEDLFDLALRTFDDQAMSGKPFFSIIMNTSNHKPFTFRTGLESMGIKPEGGGRESGVRYADYAHAYFLREAAKHPWFANTVFVIIADHGARVYGRQEIPLKTYEIPWLIYSPAHIAPRQIDSLATQIDVAPTVMGLLGLPYTAPWFGQDAIHSPEEGRVAFFSHNNDVAIYRNGVLSILGLGKTIKDVRYDFATDSYTPVKENPELDDLAIAYYQTAYELFRAHKYE